MNFTIELEGNAPKWANEATHYFENTHREQWIAKMNKEAITVTGLDIGWEEVTLNYKEAKEFLELQEEIRNLKNEKELISFRNKIDNAKENNPIFKWKFTDEEKFWLISLFTIFTIKVEEAMAIKAIKEQENK